MAGFRLPCTSDDSGLRRRPRETAGIVLEKCRRRLARKSLHATAKSWIPIIDWLPGYDWRGSFFRDISGGLTMAVFAVPTGIANAGIAGVRPVYGLYSVIFPAFFYVIFGHNRYTALGGFALLSLMIRDAVNRVNAITSTRYNVTRLINDTILPSEWSNDTDYGDLMNATSFVVREVTSEVVTDGIPEIEPIHIATTIMFISGIVHILMGMFRMDVLSSLMSEQIISGFIVGGSIHVFFAQIGDVLGVTLPPRSGSGYLYDRVWDFVYSVPHTNISTLIISLCSVFFLIFSQFVIQPWLANVFEIPVPYELILVVVGITATNFADLTVHHSINVVGNIPTVFPPPTLPRLDLVPFIFPHALYIAVTAMAIHLSVGVICKQRYHFKFDNWRELYSLGFVGVLSSFFPVFPVTSVFARSIVGTAIADSTPLTVGVSCLALLSVILYIGPALEYLPKCVLASMVIVSLIASVRKIGDARKLWPTFKCDLLIFVVSVTLTVCIDMSYGLLLSICFGLFTILARSESPRWHILTRNEATRDFRETGRKDLAYVEGNVCVMRFDSPLIFMNVRSFTKAVQRCIKIWERRDANTLYTDPMGFRWRVPGLRAMLVIDCSGFSYIDHLGLKTLKKIYVDLEEQGIVTKLAAPKVPVLRIFDSSDFYETVPQNAVFQSVGLAVHNCEQHYAALKTRMRGEQ